MASWLDARGDPVVLDEFVQSLNRESGELHVGSDSHSTGDDWLFATAVCVYVEGKGGCFYYRRSRFRKDSFPNLFDRLMKETTLSILAAEEIREITGKSVTIHADVATSSSVSSKYKGAVVSYVEAMGFPVVTKPDSWASSSIADKKAR